VLRFRAPGSRLSAAALVGRVLGIAAPRAAGRVRAGALAFADVDGRIRERVREPEVSLAPGTALLLDAAPPAAPPPAAPEAEGAWQAMAPSLPWPSGQAEGFAYETWEEREGLARLAVRLGTAISWTESPLSVPASASLATKPAANQIGPSQPLGDVHTKRACCAPHEMSATTQR
jgi:hypothetical protein